MWWRFLVFCVLVTLVLFVVLSCIYGRPVVHLFFHRCCGEDIENDQVIFENLGNNFLRERLVATEENTALIFSEDVDEDIVESTTRISFKDVVRTLRNNSSIDHLIYKDVAEVENITLFSVKDVHKVKNDFSTKPLVSNEAEVENVTLFSFEVVDGKFKNDLTTVGLNGKDSMEIENQFSFDDVGKVIDDMKRLIDINYSSTKDAYDELEARLMTDDDVSEVTTERFRKRS